MANYKMPPVQEHKEDLIHKINEFIISGIIIYIFVAFFDWLLEPFHRKSTRDDHRERIDEKQKQRNEYLSFIERDENDPMFQYQLRFLEEPKKFRGDPDNKVYEKWYGSWKKGEVLDSTLRWVPVMYDCNDDMTPEFLAYMKTQYFLHKDRAGFFNKRRFLKTIRDYYPEFSASFRGMGEDLARYCSTATDNSVEEDLRSEMIRFGLSDDYADYLIEQDLSPAELKKVAVFFRECIQRDIRLEVAVISYINGWTTEFQVVEKLEELTEQSKMPTRAIVAYMKREITLEDLSALTNDVRELYSPEDDDLGEYVDDQLKKIRAKNRALKRA